MQVYSKSGPVLFILKTEAEQLPPTWWSDTNITTLVVHNTDTTLMYLATRGRTSPTPVSYIDPVTFTESMQHVDTWDVQSTYRGIASHHSFTTPVSIMT